MGFSPFIARMRFFTAQVACRTTLSQVRDATFDNVRITFNKIWLAEPPLAIPNGFWFASLACFAV
jgi:hypothetical protein